MLVQKGFSISFISLMIFHFTNFLQNFCLVIQHFFCSFLYHFDITKQKKVKKWIKCCFAKINQIFFFLFSPTFLVIFKLYVLLDCNPHISLMLHSNHIIQFYDNQYVVEYGGRFQCTSNQHIKLTFYKKIQVTLSEVCATNTWLNNFQTHKMYLQ